MTDEFYLDLNLELYFRWLYGNRNKYDYNIHCISSSDALGKKISFELEDVVGSITIWANGIIEEEIYDRDEQLLFYLHYKLISLASGQKLFYDFYEALTKHPKSSPVKVIICCSGGLSSSYFANKLAELISLKHLNYEITALGFYQLEHQCQSYDAIYLAPQIAYLAPQAMKIVDNPALIHCISPNLYATYNYRGLLDLICKEKELS